ncbi:MAG: hypothetical protein ABI867_33905, partial [Kofleriaceae bacterium]
LMKQHLELAPPPPSSLRADLPVAFDRALARALAKSPDDRFQSAAAMAEALRHAATDLPPQQWHALSRGGVIHGGNRSITRVQPQPTPIRIKRESVEPATVAGRPQRREIDPAATVPAVPVRRRRRGAAIAAIMALATIAGLAIVIARRSHDDPVVAGSAVDPGSAVAGSAVDPGSAVVASTVDPGSAVVGSAVDPGSGAVAGSTVTGTAVVGGRARGPGVIVASGGSAADHGVTHGPGVTSRNVIVGTQTRPSTRLAIDYDPKHFDPIAYLPKARALARRVYPDAELTEFELYENVRSDGVVDLTLPSESTSYYEFRSPAHSVFPRGGKPGDEIFCYVMVDISATEVRTRLRDDDRCDRTLRGAPRCSLARVWRNALAGGVPADKPATVAFLSDGKWFFDPDHAHGGKVMSFGDCP